MQAEQIKESAISPTALTDKELISFAERYLDTGMPLSFQKEVVKRFDNVLTVNPRSIYEVAGIPSDCASVFG